MAFTSTVANVVRGVGNQIKVSGAFVNTAGSTGGVISVLPVKAVRDFDTTNTSGTSASSPSVSISGSNVTLTTDADVDGNWTAIGNG